MRVIDNSGRLARVRFSNVSVGENFYFRDKLFVKGTARLENNKLHNCGGMMTHFGFGLDDGYIMAFEPDTEVIPAKAHVVVELIGSFS